MAVFFFAQCNKNTKWYFQNENWTKKRQTSKCKRMDQFFCLHHCHTNHLLASESNWLLPILCWIDDHMHNCCNILLHSNAIVDFTWSPATYLYWLNLHNSIHRWIQYIQFVINVVWATVEWVNELNWNWNWNLSMSLCVCACMSVNGAAKKSLRPNTEPDVARSEFIVSNVHQDTKCALT